MNDETDIETLGKLVAQRITNAAKKSIPMTNPPKKGRNNN